MKGSQSGSLDLDTDKTPEVESGMAMLAIDPGTEKSVWMLYDGSSNRPIVDMGIEPNGDVLHRIRAARGKVSHVVIEMVASYGGPVGVTTFETVCWIGRFAQLSTTLGIPPSRLYRKGKDGICKHICHSSNAKDSHIRQALIDRFGPGKERAIGTKKSPGPLYGVKTHLWSALAIAVTATDKPGLLEQFPSSLTSTEVGREFTDEQLLHYMLSWRGIDPGDECEKCGGSGHRKEH